MLAEKMHQHNATAWLVNTGWTAGPYGVGYRMKLRHTRRIIDAIHNGELSRAKYNTTPIFNLHVRSRPLPCFWLVVLKRSSCEQSPCHLPVCKAPSPVSTPAGTCWQCRAPCPLNFSHPTALQIPTAVTDVPDEILTPEKQWGDRAGFTKGLRHLGELYTVNFKKYASGGGFVSKETAAAICAAGPKLE